MRRKKVSVSVGWLLAMRRRAGGRSAFRTSTCCGGRFLGSWVASELCIYVAAAVWSTGQGVRKRG